MNRMMKSFLLILTLIYLSKSIRFSIVLEQRQMQCFHEQAQKGVRYQIDIKGKSPQFGLQVNQRSTIHADSRVDEQYKFFSAFADTDIGITFCVNSLTDVPIELEVQFYHGFYLESTYQLKGSNEFLDMTRRMQQISNMIKMNYDKYKSQVLEREPINDRIQIYATFAIIVFLAILAVVKVVYLSKVVKYLKTKKII